MDEFEREDEARRIEAEAYIRSYGRDGLRSIATLFDRLEEGKPLTDVNVETALRAKAYEKRVGQAAIKRAIARERAARREADLDRIFIGPEVTDGWYAVMGDRNYVAVKVERPVQGALRGFVVATVEVAPGAEVTGLQFPQPHAVSNPAHRQFYRGGAAHLVAALVADPEKAREAYKQLEGAAA